MKRQDIFRALALGLFADLIGGMVKANSIAKTNNVVRTENPKAFNRAEIGIIAKEMGDEFTLRLSPYGNPIVTHRQTKGNNIIFCFYKREDGIIIRRRRGYDNPHGSGNVLNGGKPFPSVRDAMRYFVSYKQTYPQSLIG